MSLVLKPDSSQTFSATRGHGEKAAICKPGREVAPETNQAGTVILDFSASRTVRNPFLLFKPLSLWHFVMGSLS